MAVITDSSSEDIDLSLTNIWRSWAAFRKGKKPSREITAFEAELETNLLRLCADLSSGQYRHGGYNYRIVNEKKRRDIAVATVRDRIVHRLLYDYLVPIIDPKLDYDVWSCRKNKGLHEALTRTKHLATKYSHASVWRADISKFFDNVDQTILRSCLERYVKDEIALSLLDKVIDSYTSQLDRQTDRHGIPIGNLTSQIFANIYLQEFDRFVRHIIKPLGYVRYGDDFVLFMPDQSRAANTEMQTTEWLFDALKLKIHTKNTVVIKTGQGLKFLGHQFYPSSDVSVDRYMILKINRCTNRENVASYLASQIPNKYIKRMPWIIKNNLGL